MSDFHFDLLRAHGFIVGPRDPNMNKAFEGRYMVAEAYEKGHEQDDAQGGDGVWCIVGDDMDKLTAEAVWFFELTADKLHDWDGIDPDPIGYVLTKEDDQINATFSNGTKVWIEKQDGRIRVHCFDPKRDEPVNIEIYDTHIEVDNEEYEHARTSYQA